MFKNLFGSSESNEVKENNFDWVHLNEINQLNEILTSSNQKPFLIFKHSTRCSISRMALKQFENQFKLEEKITPYYLDLLKHREISNQISDLLQVEHQSPQLIVIAHGKSIYNVSHEDIDAEQLARII